MSEAVSMGSVQCLELLILKTTPEDIKTDVDKRNWCAEQLATHFVLGQIDIIYKKSKERAAAFMEEVAEIALQKRRTEDERIAFQVAQSRIINEVIRATESLPQESRLRFISTVHEKVVASFDADGKRMQ